MFGHPFHGLCNAGGLLLPNGTVREYPQPEASTGTTDNGYKTGSSWGSPRGQDTVIFSRNPGFHWSSSIIPDADANGFRWLPFAVLSGAKRQLYGVALEENSWLCYSSGRVWQLVAGDYAIKARVFGELGGDPSAWVTSSCSVAKWVWDKVEDISSDGRRLLVDMSEISISVSAEGAVSVSEDLASIDFHHVGDCFGITNDPRPTADIPFGAIWHQATTLVSGFYLGPRLEGVYLKYTEYMGMPPQIVLSFRSGSVTVTRDQVAATFGELGIGYSLPGLPGMPFIVFRPSNSVIGVTTTSGVYGDNRRAVLGVLSKFGGVDPTIHMSISGSNTFPAMSSDPCSGEISEVGCYV